MKAWSGKDFDYRGYHIVNDKKNRLLLIFDPNGWCCDRVNNWSHSAVTAAKDKVDYQIKNHGG